MSLVVEFTIQNLDSIISAIRNKGISIGRDRKLSRFTKLSNIRPSVPITETEVCSYFEIEYSVLSCLSHTHCPHRSLCPMAKTNVDVRMYLGTLPSLKLTTCDAVWIFFCDINLVCMRNCERKIQ